MSRAGYAIATPVVSLSIAKKTKQNKKQLINYFIIIDIYQIPQLQKQRGTVDLDTFISIEGFLCHVALMSAS